MKRPHPGHGPRLIFPLLTILLVCSYSMMSWRNIIRKNRHDRIARKALATAVTRDSQSSGERPEGKGIRTGSILEQGSRLCADLDKSAESFEDDWNSHTFYLSKMSGYDTLVTYLLTRHICSSQVTRGKSGDFLFYISKKDGNTISDFEGGRKYQRSALERMGSAALAVQTYLQSKGITSMILFIPNKENVYFEDMPGEYSHADISRTDELVRYLQSNGVNAVYCKQELLDQKEKGPQLYYSYDTHWNQAGAYIGVQAAVRRFGISIPPLDSRSLDMFALDGHYHSGATDDLANMVGLQTVFNDDLEIIIKGTSQPDWDLFDSAKQPVQCFKNPNARNNATLFLIGDSFRKSMVPLLMETFSEVWVVHRSHYNPGQIDLVKPDFMIFEYVERYSGKIRHSKTFIP